MATFFSGGTIWCGVGRVAQSARVDGGKIVEDGMHDELLARGALYKTLWDAQVGGFLPEVREL